MRTRALSPQVCTLFKVCNKKILIALLFKLNTIIPINTSVHQTLYSIRHVGYQLLNVPYNVHADVHKALAHVRHALQFFMAKSPTLLAFQVLRHILKTHVADYILAADGPFDASKAACTFLYSLE
jgi:hypothetical protein